MKILLAEDDPNIATIARMSLEHLGGHEVHWASDGEIALSRANTEKFDVILLDEMMPKMNGIRVCEEYQAGQPTAPVIFLSAKATDCDIQRFNELGLGLIPKPFDPTQLCKLIDDLLAKGTEVA
ncbi:MAG: response regulator [Bdellovibrionales bacterium]|nr:response regulator [Bdellovibrionales bacterium]